MIFRICSVALETLEEKKKILCRSFCFQNPIVPDEIKEKRTKSEFQIRALHESLRLWGFLRAWDDPPGAEGCSNCVSGITVSGIGLHRTAVDLDWSFIPIDLGLT